MELTEAIRRRHMTRNFTGRPLPVGLIDALVADALRAPSAGNTQGRELVVLEGPEQTAAFWDATTDEAWRGRSRRLAGLSLAPVIVLLYGDPEAYAARYDEPDKRRADGTVVEWVVPYWYVDASFAAMTLLLRATDEGLGAAFLGNFRGEDALGKVLGIPPGMRWLGAVLLGEAATPDPPSSSLSRPRRHAGEVVHRARW